MRHAHVVRSCEVAAKRLRRQGPIRTGPGFKAPAPLKEDCRTVKHTGLGAFRWFA